MAAASFLFFHIVDLWPLLFFHPPLRLCDLVKLQSSCKKQNLLNELMDHSGNYVQTALPFILSLLERGLGQRIHLLTHSLTPDPEVVKNYVKSHQSYDYFNSVDFCPLKAFFSINVFFWRSLFSFLFLFPSQWSVESEAPKYKAQPPLSFGLLLRPELAATVLERGPPADSPQFIYIYIYIYIYILCPCSYFLAIQLELKGHWHIFGTLPKSFILLKMEKLWGHHLL